MALPHLPTSYTTSKNAYETAIIRRRNHDVDYRDKWSQNAKYFNNFNVETTKQKAWSSKESFMNSMEAFNSQKTKGEKQKKLEERQARLAKMLKEEREQLQAELRGLSGENFKRLDDMKDRSETLRSAREDRRKALAQDLLMEHWRQNNPDLRKVESNLHSNHVIHSWSGQVEERHEIAEKERLEKEEFEAQAEKERLAALETAREIERQKIEDEKKLKGILRQQVTELKVREREAVMLKQQQELMQQQQWEFDKMEEHRRALERERKNQQHGRILLRQHNAALRRKSKQIQDELEQDRRFLQELIDQEHKEQEIQTARREKQRADAAWMKQVIEEQIRVEKTREAELDQLYQDEAARVWQKREADWERERQARDRLMKEVLDARQEQIEDRMQQLQIQQQESITQREELLQDLEMAQQLTRREEKQKEADKLARKDELVAQMTDRREQQERAQLRLNLAEMEEKEAEDNYHQMLQREADRLSARGFTPKHHGRKQAWM